MKKSLKHLSIAATAAFSIVMCAEIELNEAEFDEETPALVNEIDDAYGMTFSTMFQ